MNEFLELRNTLHAPLPCHSHPPHPWLSSKTDCVHPTALHCKQKPLLPHPIQIGSLIVSPVTVSTCRIRVTSLFEDRMAKSCSIMEPPSFCTDWICRSSGVTVQRANASDTRSSPSSSTPSDLFLGIWRSRLCTGFGLKLWLSLPEHVAVVGCLLPLPLYDVPIC